MRLIDADELLIRVDSSYAHSGLCHNCYSKFKRWIRKNHTAIDAVQIVRCRDCKYCYSIDSDPMEPDNGENYWYCERWDQSTSAYGTDPERFYCADAERRDGE